MPRWLQVALTLVLFTAPAKAEEPPLSPTLIRVFNNFAHEHATCAAYMIVASKCFQTDKDPTLRERLATVGSAAITRGQEWTARAKLKPETFVARIQIDTQQMVTKLESNCSNISLLLAEHAAPCKLLIDDPDKRIETLTDEVMAKEAQGR
ncbi:hypothetical protein [Methylobacterium sp. E-045]|uniref:hypothetical protein n=1 Tax=Methylobacterium sp. E-045 TaxID=2836575 RepID=UPI001FBAF75F|nr:hypothetical protein [Methylobacterium sp. E-045]MCJ2127345.1 hypothetical protein [Methylobacterium sp. E-045]